MKIVLNKCFGGFALSSAACRALGLKSPYDTIDRTDERLIALIEEHGSKWVSSCLSKLTLIDVSDNCTDWEMAEYDGWESITYVVDGKLYHA